MKEKLYSKSLFISIAFLLLLVKLSYSQDYLVRDFDFNSNSVTTNGTTYAVEVLNDPVNKGKILMAGFFNYYNGISVPGKIVRLNPDGSYDNTFVAPALSSYWGGSGGGIYTIAVQPWDGKVVIGGEFSIQSGGKSFTNIVRLNTNGSLDLTFNSTGGGTRDGALFGKVTKVLALNPEKQIVVSGMLGSYNGITIGNNRGGVFIINENGSLYKDAKVTSTSSDWTGEGVTDMALTPDGKIVIGGEFGRVDTYLARRVARLNRDGSFDPTWTNEGYLGVGPSGHVTSVAVQADGKIIIGGQFDFYNEYNRSLGVTKTIYRTRIARLNVNGKVDNTFNYDNATSTWLTRGFNAEVRDILIDSKGNIYAAGLFTEYGGEAASVSRITRLLPDGTLDKDFNSSVFDNGVYGIAFQDWNANGTYKPEAHLLAVGTFESYSAVYTQKYSTRFTIVPATPSPSTAGGSDPPTAPPTPLAKTITDFTVIKLSESKNKLSWKALLSPATYSVQRSFDGKNYQNVASYATTTANAILMHEDVLTNSGVVYYRIVISTGSIQNAKPVEYSSVVTVNMSKGLSTNLSLKEHVLAVTITSSMASNETFNLQVLTLDGQQLVAKQLTLKNKVINETIWSTQSMKDCLVVLSASNGEVLKKVLFK